MLPIKRKTDILLKEEQAKELITRILRVEHRLAEIETVNLEKKSTLALKAAGNDLREIKSLLLKCEGYTD